MNFQDAEIDQRGTPNAKSKVLGVIVLTDNRQIPRDAQQKSPTFRCSAFKETEVDPLDYGTDPPQHLQDENSLLELSRRVAYLQARVEALSKNEVMSQEGQSSQKMQKKKNRRRFKELVRDQQCPHCKKVYGSETSLKYHLKLKHKGARSHSQAQ